MKPKDEQFLSLVSPAYNEESNLRALYDEMRRLVPKTIDHEGRST